MLKVEYQNQFKKDYKLALKRGCNAEDFKKVISILMEGKPLPERYKDHALTSSRNYKDVRECHIKPDWLLIYKICKDKLVLLLVRTGTHSDLY